MKNNSLTVKKILLPAKQNYDKMVAEKKELKT